MADKELRKQKITARRQEQILQAGMDVFTLKGYAAATIPQIARAAGVAAGTIYLYYPSKRELFIAVIKKLIITAPLLQLIDKIPQGNIEVIFKNIIKDRLELIKNPAFGRIPSLIAEILRDPELRALWLQEFLHPFLGRIETGYRALAASGKINSLEPPVAVRVIGGMFLGFLVLRLAEGDTSPLHKMPEEQVTDEIVSFVLHGLLGENGGEKH
ncbi:MAG: TetR/AcrR family transcriptional regulator [Dehalococcoidales bacterium]